MFNVVLVHPEIPPNTGNVIRLCANTGCALHLVRPLGFSLEDKHMKRAGLDYWEYATLRIHDSFEHLFLSFLQPRRLVRFRLGRIWTARRNTGAISLRAANPSPDEARQPLAQPLQCRRRYGF